MEVYVVIAQPDGDWDHMATFLGVYTNVEAARNRAKGWSPVAIIKCDTDKDSDSGYARSNV